MFISKNTNKGLLLSNIANFIYNFLSVRLVVFLFFFINLDFTPGIACIMFYNRSRGGCRANYSLISNYPTPPPSFSKELRIRIYIDRIRTQHLEKKSRSDPKEKPDPDTFLGYNRVRFFLLKTGSGLATLLLCTSCRLQNSK